MKRGQLRLATLIDGLDDLVMAIPDAELIAGAKDGEAKVIREQFSRLEASRNAADSDLDGFAAPRNRTPRPRRHVAATFKAKVKGKDEVKKAIRDALGSKGRKKSR